MRELCATWNNEDEWVKNSQIAKDSCKTQYKIGAMLLWYLKVTRFGI